MNYTKWLIIAAAVGIHISIGSVYAWSVFVKPIMAYLGCSLADVQFAFSIAILFLGLSAGFLGKYVEKYGPRAAALTSTILFFIGMAGTGLAIYLKSLFLLYLFYGVIGGTGLGIGYIAPVSTLVKHFPDKKGLAGGFAIMGFGFASLIAGPVIQKLIEVMAIYYVPVTMGIAYFIIMFTSSMLFSKLPKTDEQVVLTGFKMKEAITTPTFIRLWLMLFLNIFCGIAIISVASPLAQEMLYVGPLAAAMIVGLIGMFNGLGRILWPMFSDYFGRKKVYTAIYIVQIVSFVLIAIFPDPIVFKVLIYLVATCYGAGFALMPAYLGDMFGTKELGAIHGRLLTAWAAAGLTAPLFISWFKITVGMYAPILDIFGIVLAFAVLISLTIKKPEQKETSEN